MHRICENCKPVRDRTPLRSRDHAFYIDYGLQIKLENKVLEIKTFLHSRKLDWNVRQFSVNGYEGIFIADHIENISKRSPILGYMFIVTISVLIIFVFIS
jgi:hypothetical protein